eukprot:TRINITY_DN30085_c0_g1_i2.p1 TRINITY_DN30085_c0_g1~~TRINITY_DN30085_c0_g1_i2.p1  ORF type:complete len:266 (+),score=23.83 TRINITY_DN30085_c0_g1_i2:58-855(+)
MYKRQPQKQHGCIVECTAFWMDVLVLIVIICPLAVSFIAAILGGVLAGCEGWPYDVGFWYVSGSMSGQPVPFVPQTPQTPFGRTMDIVIGYYTVIMSTLIIGLVAMLTNVSSLTNGANFDKDSFGIVLLLVILPLCAFIATFILGLVVAGLESWEIITGLRYTISVVTGAPLESIAPASLWGKIFAVVIGVVDAGLFGTMIGAVSSISFIKRFMNHYQAFFEQCEGVNEHPEHLKHPYEASSLAATRLDESGSLMQYPNETAPWG